jgi:hypothetical protein
MLKKYLKNQNINLKVMSDNNRSEIKFLVELDENRVPEIVVVSSRRWHRISRSEAIMLSVWDSKVKESMRIDLWTKICLLMK